MQGDPSLSKEPSLPGELVYGVCHWSTWIPWIALMSN